MRIYPICQNCGQRHAPSSPSSVTVGAMRMRPNMIVPPIANVPSIVDMGLMDRILRSCPTPQEIASIGKDFPIYIDDPEQNQIVCGVGGGTKPTTLLTIINAFRCMKALNFDAPMPVINATNTYQWMSGHGLTIHESTGITVPSTGPGITKIEVGSHLGEPWSLQWDDADRPGIGRGMCGMVQMLIHETVHAVLRKYHNVTNACDGYRLIDGGVNSGHMILRMPDGSFLLDDAASAEITAKGLDFTLDSSPEYGGACGAGYWFAVWMAKHSGDALSAWEKQSAAAWAVYNRHSFFQDGGVDGGVCGGGGGVQDRANILHTLAIESNPNVDWNTRLRQIMPR